MVNTALRYCVVCVCLDFKDQTESLMVFASLKYYKNTSEEETCKQSELEH